MIRLSPRKPGSGWSGVNKSRIAALIAAGRMMPAGVARIAAAKRDGSWTALDGASDLSIPDDLSNAFDDYPGASDRFADFPPSARRSILEWITLAKRAETRAQRVTETARRAQLGERANQWSKRPSEQE